MLSARAYDRNPVDATSVAFTLFDETDGTSRTISGASATRYSAATLWAKTAAGQVLAIGHTYRLRFSIKDVAGNQTTVEQRPAADGGGFLASTVSVPTVPAAPGAEIVERPCSVRQPDAAKGETMATVECVEVPVAFTAATVRVAASKGAGSVPVKLSAPLQGVTIRYGVAGALTQANTSVSSSSAEATTKATGVVASATPADYTAPGSEAVLPKITAAIPPGLDTATVVMPRVDAAATLTGCADMTAAYDITCHPDHVVPALGVTRERSIRSGFRWDSATGTYVVDPLTITDRDTDEQSNVTTTTTTTSAAAFASASASGSSSTGNGCESAEPGRMNSPQPLHFYSSEAWRARSSPMFSWLFYVFFKDDGRVFTDSVQDIADVCYTGWHNPGANWRMTRSGATVGIPAADATLIQNGGGSGETRDPTAVKLGVQITGGPVQISAELVQNPVDRVKHEPGPGPADVEWHGTGAGAMHSAWWEHQCSWFSCLSQYRGSTNSQGNVGQAVFRMNREVYSEMNQPYAGFDTYIKVHCEATTAPWDDNCWDSRNWELIG